VRVIDRDTHRVLPLYGHRGELWLPGEPGSRYALELFNLSGKRLLNVVSVDGINVITGESAAYQQSGYVLSPGQQYDVSGWRKSRREVAVFRFASLPDSAKWLLSLGMLLGRLEILTVLVLVTRSFWKH
jgi:hypothetical protein